MFLAAARPGTFMCGCDPETKRARYGGKRWQGVVGGIEVCPEHGEPLYGYRSPQMEHPGLGRQLDYAKKSSGGELTLIVQEPDKRDNRDPLRARDDYLFEKTINGNGHH